MCRIGSPGKLLKQLLRCCAGFTGVLSTQRNEQKLCQTQSLCRASCKGLACISGGLAGCASSAAQASSLQYARPFSYMCDATSLTVSELSDTIHATLGLVTPPLEQAITVGWEASYCAVHSNNAVFPRVLRRRRFVLSRLSVKSASPRTCPAGLWTG